MAAEDSKRRQNEIQTDGKLQMFAHCIFVKAKPEKALEEGR